MERREGWELRLATAIEAARGERYVLGTHDCFRVALRAVEALTGVDLWPCFAGRYGTRREALRLLAEHGGFDAGFSGLFGCAPAPATRARRGDICKYEDAEAHLGVCVGAHVAVLKEDGLAFVPLAACACCWGIG